MRDFIFLGSKITANGDYSHEIKRHLLFGSKAITNQNGISKSRDSTLQTKVCIVKAMFFSSSHICMWDLDHKESWAPKSWSFWTVVLEKILESPLDCKAIQPVNPKGNQSWILIGRTDAEAKLQYFGHLMWRSVSLERTLMLGKISFAGRERDDRDGWMVSPTRWTWVWVSSRCWWWTGKTGML